MKYENNIPVIPGEHPLTEEQKEFYRQRGADIAKADALFGIRATLPGTVNPLSTDRWRSLCEGAASYHKMKKARWD